jgi:hypothetical protein
MSNADKIKALNNGYGYNQEGGKTRSEIFDEVTTDFFGTTDA